MLDLWPSGICSALLVVLSMTAASRHGVRISLLNVQASCVQLYDLGEDGESTTFVHSIDVRTLYNKLKSNGSRSDATRKLEEEIAASEKAVKAAKNGKGTVEFQSVLIGFSAVPISSSQKMQLVLTSAAGACNEAVSRTPHPGPTLLCECFCRCAHMCRNYTEAADPKLSRGSLRGAQLERDPAACLSEYPQRV